MTLTPALQNALGLHQAGRLEEAEKAYRSVIAEVPDNAEALQFLGVLLGQSERLAEAYDAFALASDLTPENPDLLYNLGECARRLDRRDDAEAIYRRALKAAPGHPDAALNLAGMLVQQGKSADAVEICKSALARSPEHPQLRNQLGSALLELRDFAAAREQFEAALQQDRGNPNVSQNLAAALIGLEAYDIALPLLHDLFGRNKQSPDILYMAGTTLDRTGRHSEAENLLKRALELAPERVDILVALAFNQRELRNAEEALGLLQRAIDVEPDNARLLAQYALILVRLSRLDDASDPLARAMAIDPNDSVAVIAAAQIARRTGRPADAYTLVSKTLKAPHDRDTQAALSFELGFACEALDRHEEAFRAFSEGNARIAEQWGTSSIDTTYQQRLNERLMASFGAEEISARIAVWPQAAPAGDRPAPSFLVGFPRSGTTLLERVLDSHPDILATDELGMVNAMRHSISAKGNEDAYPANLDALDDNAIANMREAYWSFFDAHAPESLDGRRLVDKHPLNIEHLPLIYRAFPDARVLVALRDPRDVCISCFTTAFGPNRATVHFLDLADIAKTYADVMSLWQRYREILPMAIHQYRYEDLAAAPEATLREIVQFLGLAWREDLLEGAQRSSGRLVSTPSYSGVAEPINARAVGRWHGYADRLAPLTPVLQPFIEAFGYTEPDSNTRH